MASASDAADAVVAAVRCETPVLVIIPVTAVELQERPFFLVTAWLVSLTQRYWELIVTSALTSILLLILVPAVELQGRCFFLVTARLFSLTRRYLELVVTSALTSAETIQV